MPYAILQKTLSPPSREQLANAFRSLPALTDYDAAFLAKDAFGILVSNISLDEARTLSQALTAEGVDNEVVDEQDLFTLPPFKKTRRLDCLPESLVLYDQYDRPHSIDWPHVILIAAGTVAITELKRFERQRVRYHITPSTFARGVIFPSTTTEVTLKEEEKPHLLLEIYLDVAPVRSHADAHEVRYNYLGPRLQSRALNNFPLLVADLAKFATAASLNRGAQSISHDPAKTFQYPNRHAFEEEIVWLLWRGGWQLKSQT